MVRQNIIKKFLAFLERERSAVAKAMAGQGEKNNEADVRLLFSRKEVFPLSFASSPHIGNKALKKLFSWSSINFGYDDRGV